MTTDSKWLVRLHGDSDDLQLAGELFCDGKTRVYRRDQEWLLDSEVFEALPDSGAVHREARRLSEWISGATNAHFGGCNPIGAGAVIREYNDGRRDAFVFAETLTATLNFRGFAKAVVIGADGKEKPSPPPPARKWVQVAPSDARVAEVLEYMAMVSHDFSSLYKLYELVAKGVGGVNELKLWVASNGVCAPSDLSSFTETANNHYASGRAARHANIETPASGNPTMTIKQAQELIFKLVRAWLMALD